MEVGVVLQDMANDRAQEHDIAASAVGNMHIRQGRCARIVGVDVNNLSPKLLRFDNMAEGDRMGLSHVAAHD